MSLNSRGITYFLFILILSKMKRAPTLKDFIKTIKSFLIDYKIFFEIVGILTLLATLIFTYEQIKLTNESLLISRDQYRLQFIPNWRTSIIHDEDNNLNDMILFESKNEAIQLQNIEIGYLNYDKYYHISTTYNKWKTAGLKDSLINILSDYYISDTTHYLINIPRYIDQISYPISIKFRYVEFGKRVDTTAIYKYSFKTYLFDGHYWLKSTAIEFLGYTLKDSTIIKKELLKENFAECFFSNNKLASQRLKNKLIESSNLYRPLFEYIEKNLSLTNARYPMVYDGTNRPLGDTILLTYPRYWDDKNFKVEHDKYLYFIEKNSPQYDFEIKSLLSKINKEELEFKPISSDPVASIDSVYNSTTKTVFPENTRHLKIWLDLNNKLLELLYKKIKVV
jgi:hypothetical protein